MLNKEITNGIPITKAFRLFQAEARENILIVAEA
jgi:hypothetical protein